MTAPSPAASPGPWQRMWNGLRRRPTRGQTAVAALCGLLGFAMVTQVHATSASNGLAAARPEDLLGILSDLNNRADRLREEIGTLEVSRQRLQSGTGQTQAALQEARHRAQTLGILTGTVAATGPGIVLTIHDARGSVPGDVLVDVVQELRDAGAEAMQISGVRVVASTWIVDDVVGGVDIDGTRVTAPYRFVVIGDSRTLAGALGIPGGVLDTIDGRRGADASVTQSAHLTVSALRPLRPPRYARSSR